MAHLCYWRGDSASRKVLMMLLMLFTAFTGMGQSKYFSVLSGMDTEVDAILGGSVTLNPRPQMSISGAYSGVVTVNILDTDATTIVATSEVNLNISEMWLGSGYIYFGYPISLVNVKEPGSYLLRFFDKDGDEIRRSDGSEALQPLRILPPDFEHMRLVSLTSISSTSDDVLPLNGGRLTLTMRNDGTSPVALSDVTLTDNNRDFEIHFNYSGTIGVGASLSLSTLWDEMFVFPSTGEYNFTGKFHPIVYENDPYGEPSEQWIDFAGDPLAVQVEEAMSVLALTVEPSRSYVVAGKSFTFCFNLKNKGEQYNGNIFMHVHAANDDDVDVVEIPVDYIYGNGQKNVSVTHTFDNLPVGEYTYSLTDIYGNPLTYNEEVYTGHITVVETASVSLTSFGPADGSAFSNLTTRVKAVMTNTLGRDIDAYFKFYIDDRIVRNSSYAVTIPNGGSYTTTFNITALSAGTHKVIGELTIEDYDGGEVVTLEGSPYTIVVADGYSSLRAYSNLARDLVYYTDQSPAEFDFQLTNMNETDYVGKMVMRMEQLYVSDENAKVYTFESDEFTVKGDQGHQTISITADLSNCEEGYYSYKLEDASGKSIMSNGTHSEFVNTCMIRRPSALTLTEMTPADGAEANNKATKWTLTIKNTGSLNCSGEIYLYLDNSQNAFKVISNVNVAPNGTYNLTFNQTFTPGSHTIEAYIIEYDEINEMEIDRSLSGSPLEFSVADARGDGKVTLLDVVLPGGDEIFDIDNESRTISLTLGLSDGTKFTGDVMVYVADAAYPDLVYGASETYTVSLTKDTPVTIDYTFNEAVASSTTYMLCVDLVPESGSTEPGSGTAVEAGRYAFLATTMSSPSLMVLLDENKWLLSKLVVYNDRPQQFVFYVSNCGLGDFNGRLGVQAKQGDEVVATWYGSIEHIPSWASAEGGYLVRHKETVTIDCAELPTGQYTYNIVDGEGNVLMSELFLEPYDDAELVVAEMPTLRVSNFAPADGSPVFTTGEYAEYNITVENYGEKSVTTTGIFLTMNGSSTLQVSEEELTIDPGITVDFGVLADLNPHDSYTMTGSAIVDGETLPFGGEAYTFTPLTYHTILNVEGVEFPNGRGYMPSSNKKMTLKVRNTSDTIDFTGDLEVYIWGYDDFSNNIYGEGDTISVNIPAGQLVPVEVSAPTLPAGSYGFSVYYKHSTIETSIDSNFRLETSEPKLAMSQQINGLTVWDEDPVKTISFGLANVGLEDYDGPVELNVMTRYAERTVARFESEPIHVEAGVYESEYIRHVDVDFSNLPLGQYVIYVYDNRGRRIDAQAPGVINYISRPELEIISITDEDDGIIYDTTKTAIVEIRNNGNVDLPNANITILYNDEQYRRPGPEIHAGQTCKIRVPLINIQPGEIAVTGTYDDIPFKSEPYMMEVHDSNTSVKVRLMSIKGYLYDESEDDGSMLVSSVGNSNYTPSHVLFVSLALPWDSDDASHGIDIEIRGDEDYAYNDVFHLDNVSLKAGETRTVRVPLYSERGCAANFILYASHSDSGFAIQNAPMAFSVKDVLTSIEELAEGNVTVTSQNGTIYVSGVTKDTLVSVYDVAGGLVMQEKSAGTMMTLRPQRHQMYMVKVGNAAFKVIVR